MARPKISEVAARLQTVALDDPEALRELLSLLREMRALAREHGAPDVAACLEAAGLVTELLLDADVPLDREALRASACGLLDVVRRRRRAGARSEDAVPKLDRPQTANEAPLPAPVPAPPPVLDLGGLAAPTADPPPGDAPRKAGPATGDGAMPAPCELSFESLAPALGETIPTAASAEAPAVEPQLPAPEETPAPSADESGQDLRLGQMLLTLGHVDEEALQAALAMQAETGLRLGECLLLSGAASPDHLLSTLKLQEQLRAEREGLAPPDAETPAAPPAAVASAPPIADGGGWKPARKVPMRVTSDMFLGEVLLGAEMITNGDLERAMHLHHLEQIKVGQALVKLGAISGEDLACGLELQRRLCGIAGLGRQFEDRDGSPGPPPRAG